MSEKGRSLEGMLRVQSLVTRGGGGCKTGGEERQETKIQKEERWCCLRPRSVDDYVHTFPANIWIGYKWYYFGTHRLNDSAASFVG